MLSVLLLEFSATRGRSLAEGLKSSPWQVRRVDPARFAGGCHSLADVARRVVAELPETWQDGLSSGEVMTVTDCATAPVGIELSLLAEAVGQPGRRTLFYDPAKFTRAQLVAFVAQGLQCREGEAAVQQVAGLVADGAADEAGRELLRSLLCEFNQERLTNVPPRKRERYAWELSRLQADWFGFLGISSVWCEPSEVEIAPWFVCVPDHHDPNTRRGGVDIMCLDAAERLRGSLPEILTALSTPVGGRDD